MNNKKRQIHLEEGALVKCEPALGRYLVWLNDKEVVPFIIHQLDQHHFFVKAEAAEMIKARTIEFVADSYVRKKRRKLDDE